MNNFVGHYNPFYDILVWYKTCLIVSNDLAWKGQKLIGQDVGLYLKAAVKRTMCQITCTRGGGDLGVENCLCEINPIQPMHVIRQLQE